MFLALMLQKESYKWWKENINDPKYPWTAEFMLGWKMAHRPWMFLLSLLEIMAEVLLVTGLCVIFSH